MEMLLKIIKIISAVTSALPQIALYSYVIITLFLAILAISIPIGFCVYGYIKAKKLPKPLSL